MRRRELELGAAKGLETALVGVRYATGAETVRCDRIVVGRTVSPSKTEWWLMDCSLPDLNWARLRVYADGTAGVFDCDAKLSRFESYQDAANFLAEDEFIRFEHLAEYVAEDVDLSFNADYVSPPVADSDAELAPLMLQKWRAGTNEWRPR